MALVEVVLAAEDEVDVLVGLGLVGLVRRLGERRTVERVVAVVRDPVGGVGVRQGQVAPGDRRLGGRRRQDVVLDAELRVGVRDVDDRQAAVRVGRGAAEGEGGGRGERADEPGLDDGGSVHGEASRAWGLRCPKVSCQTPQTFPRAPCESGELPKSSPGHLGEVAGAGPASGAPGAPEAASLCRSPPGPGGYVSGARARCRAPRSGRGEHGRPDLGATPAALPRIAHRDTRGRSRLDRHTRHRFRACSGCSPGHAGTWGRSSAS